MSVVLVATSDGGFMSILEAEVEAEGHALLWASDGKEALDITLKEAPELVLLDLNLPVFNGIECATALRGDPEIPHDLPIILVSDDEVDPHVIEGARITRQFPKTHGAVALRDVLVDYLQGYRKR